MSWLLRLIGVVRQPARVRLLPAAPLAPDWTDEHRKAWAQFLKTPAGQVLAARANAVCADVAARSCQDVFHTEHSAGRAAGCSDLRDWIFSLSRVARDMATPDSEESREGEDLPAERWSP